jgi:benzoyl-CoA reductase/2-hydroxyglutaryl-CoA dehydratase subunit BcrC/BadD/HgdB
VISEFKERLDKRHAYSRELKQDGKKIMACFYGLVPKELIHAAGIVPIQLIEERNPRYEEKSELLPYLCGMSKNLTGQIYENVFDYVDGAMVGTVCDTNRHVYDIWAHRKLFPHLFLVRAPSTASTAAVDYYTTELKRLAGELEKISGQKVTEDGLCESIALYNENRELFEQFYALRPKADISAEDSIHIFSSGLVTPVETLNDMLRRLLSDLSATSAPNHNIKLMLCAINLNMAVDVIRMSEKYGAAVVTDDLTHNARYGSNIIDMDGDPFEALARGYLRKVPAPGIYSYEERATEIKDRMARAGAQGMIYLIQLYCDAYAIEYAILKERFDQWDLSYLKLEAEDTPSSIEQLNVRVQSFVESLL